MVGLKYVIGKMKPYMKGVLVSLVLSLILSGLETVQPIILKKISSNIEDMLIPGCIGMLLVLITTRAFVYIKRKLLDRASEQTRIDIQLDLFNHFMNKDLADINDKSTGYMENMITNDCNTAFIFIRKGPDALVDILGSIVCSSIMMGKLFPKLLVITLPFILITLLFELLAPKLLLLKPCKEARESIGELCKFRSDKLTGIRDIISFNTQEREVSRLKDLSNNCLKNIASKSNASNAYATTIMTLKELADLVIIVTGGMMVLNHQMQLADLMIFFSYSYVIYRPVLSIADLIDLLSEGITSLNKITEELCTEPEIKSGELKPEIKGNISFDNVGFGYTKDNQVLSNISLNIKPGEYVALVGPSGAGKSTIINLMNRLYDATEGTVSIDGVNIKDIDLGYLRRNIGTVRQDARLFNTSIKGNIAYAVPEASMEDIMKAAKAANADEFISKLPDGYDTIIGENGVKLSGGQKQRIAIARLFLSNPSVCIFDEATSALDNHSEKVVKKAMDELASGRTSIVIAHRLETIKNADRIIYIDGGGIQEQGSHQELMKKEGLYYNLYKSSIE